MRNKIIAAAGIVTILAFGARCAPAWAFHIHPLKRTARIIKGGAKMVAKPVTKIAVKTAKKAATTAVVAEVKTKAF